MIVLGKANGNPYSSCVVAPRVVFDKVETSDDQDGDDAKLTPPYTRPTRSRRP